MDYLQVNGKFHISKGVKDYFTWNWKPFFWHSTKQYLLRGLREKSGFCENGSSSVEDAICLPHRVCNLLLDIWRIFLAPKSYFRRWICHRWLEIGYTALFDAGSHSAWWPQLNAGGMFTGSKAKFAYFQTPNMTSVDSSEFERFRLKSWALGSRFYLDKSIRQVYVSYENSKVGSMVFWLFDSQVGVRKIKHVSGEFMLMDVMP